MRGEDAEPLIAGRSSGMLCIFDVAQYNSGKVAENS